MGQPRTPLDRNLGLELVRATEAAALAAARWMGRGDKMAVDQVAVDAMRFALQTVDMDGTVVIGEGEKDEAPMLYIGERIGNGNQPEVDVAVDPVDGTTLTSLGGAGAISVVALAERNSLFFTHCAYMDKIVVGPEAKGKVDIDAPPADNIQAVARAVGKDLADVTAVILNRTRNEQLVADVRATGARIRLIGDGDVAAGLMAMMEEHSGIDILMGIGGSPEGVLVGCAVRCLGGDMQARLWPRDEAERQLAVREGHTVDRVLTMNDLCRGENVFLAATGVTDGEMLKGVRYGPRSATTESIVMRSVSGTIRWITSKHDFDRLSSVAGDRYDA
jgi:fructose-1,6-bisphosphatase II